MFKKYVFLLLTLFFLGGCNLFPDPGKLIEVPKQLSAEAKVGQNLQSLAQKYLPKGTVFYYPNAPVGTDAVLSGDLDGDGKEEITVFYKDKKDQVSAFVLKREKDNWKKIFAKKESVHEISWVSLSDITGDGKKELLIGWKQGISAGNLLEIYTWEDNKLKELSKLNYHELEIIQFENDPKTKLALWRKDIADVYNVELVEWKDESFVPNKANYSSYFPKVVEYYKHRIEEMPEAAFYWYYLADAYRKSNQSDLASYAIKKGITLNPSYPSYEDFIVLNREIDKEIQVSKDITRRYDIAGGGLTIEIPSELAPYIRFEEKERADYGYEVSVFVADLNNKKLLFSIEAHLKEVTQDNPNFPLEKIAETKQFIYFVKRENENNLKKMTDGFSKRYIKSYEMREKMISSIEIGSLYPKYTSLEDETVIQTLKKAVKKYKHIVKGGDSQQETFSLNDTEYRYLGSDVNSNAKLSNYLMDTFTVKLYR